MKNLQYLHKTADTVEQYKQMRIQQAHELQEKLVREAENKVISHLTSKYGATRLAKASKVDLEYRIGKQNTPVFDGAVTVFAEISAGRAAKNLSMNVQVVHSTLSLPKYRFIDKLVSEAKTTDELRQALLDTPAQPASQQVKVALDQFTLVDTDDTILEVYHSLDTSGPIGRMSKGEFEQCDYTPIYPVGFSGTFSSDHPQAILAGKDFKLIDVDGDSLKVEVGKVKGWLQASDLVLQPTTTSECPSPAVVVGSRVLVTPGLSEYYGDTVVASDLHHKVGVVSKMSNTHAFLDIEGIAEQVELPLTHLDSLKVLPQASTSATPKLEQILRTIVTDHFAGQDVSIRFVGQFRTPNLLHKPTRVLASSQQEEAEESSMSANDLTTRFKQSHGYDQFMAFEMQKIASQKRSVVERISSEVISYLNKHYSPARVLKSTSELDFSYGEGYRGKLAVCAEVCDQKGTKRIEFEVPVEADKGLLPKLEDLQTLVSQASTEEDKTLKQLEAEAVLGAAKVDAELAYEENLTQVAAKDSQLAVTTKPSISKEATNYNFVPNEQLGASMAINKAFFPASLEVGAVIDLGDGLRYKLVSKNVGQLSKGPDDGSMWLFELAAPPTTEPSSYRISNY